MIQALASYRSLEKSTLLFPKIFSYPPIVTFPFSFWRALPEPTWLCSSKSQSELYSYWYWEQKYILSCLRPNFVYWLSMTTFYFVVPCGNCKAQETSSSQCYLNQLKTLRPPLLETEEELWAWRCIPLILALLEHPSGIVFWTPWPYYKEQVDLWE